ncbi:MAG: four helix bundle protein [Reichenbachiella sp.]
MHDYKKLHIWKRSMNLVTEIYEITEKFPSDQKFGLTNQIQRSAVSVPSNIAEGSGRSTDKSFSHFLSIAMGSLCELETQIIISKNLNYIHEDTLGKITLEINEIQKMIRVFSKNLESRV